MNVNTAAEEEKGGIFEARVDGSYKRLEVNWNNGRYVIQSCSQDAWGDCEVKGYVVSGFKGMQYSFEFAWDGLWGRWYVDGIEVLSAELPGGFGVQTPQFCYTQSGGLKGWKGSVQDFSYAQYTQIGDDDEQNENTVVCEGEPIELEEIDL